MADAAALKAYGLSDADIASLMALTPDMNFGSIDLTSGVGPLAGVGTYDGETQTFTAPLSNKGNPTSRMYGNVFAVTPTSNVRLVNNATGEVVYAGTGYDAAQKATELAQGLTDEFGRKANWDIQTDTSGRFTGGPDMFESVANEKPNKSTLGAIGSVLGTALPIAMIPLTMGASAPLAGLGTAGTIGLGAGVGGVSAGLKGQNILKGAVLGGATAAGGQFLGGATGPLGKLGLSTDVANAVGTGIGATGGGLATGRSLTDALKGGVMAGGAQYLGSKLFGTSGDPLVDEWAKSQGIYDPYSLETPTIGSGVVGTTLPAPSAAPTSAPAAAPSVDPALVVNATRLSGPTFFGASNVIPSARYSGDGPTPSKEIEVEAQKTDQAQQPGFAVNVPTSTSDFLTDIEVKALRDAAALEEGQGVAPAFAIDTGTQPVIDEKEIKVTAKKADATDTGTGTPPPFNLLDLITDPEVKKDLESGKDDGKSDAEKIADYMRLAGLGVGLVGNVFGGGKDTGAGTGRYSSGKGSLGSVFSAKLPTPGTAGAFTVGGLKGTAGGADPLAARPTADWYRYATGPAMDIPAGTDLSNATSPYAGFGPGTLGEEEYKRITGMSHGGAMGYSRGSSRDSFAVEGPGTGRSDDIPAVLSDGEYVIDAETVALLGDGSSKAGAKKLDDLRVKVRKHKGKNLAKGKFSVNAKRPEAYMSGGRI